MLQDASPGHLQGCGSCAKLTALQSGRPPISALSEGLCVPSQGPQPPPMGLSCQPGASASTHGPQLPARGPQLPPGGRVPLSQLARGVLCPEHPSHILALSSWVQTAPARFCPQAEHSLLAGRQVPARRDRHCGVRSVALFSHAVVALGQWSRLCCGSTSCCTCGPPQDCSVHRSPDLGSALQLGLLAPLGLALVRPHLGASGLPPRELLLNSSPLREATSPAAPDDLHTRPLRGA